MEQIPDDVLDVASVHVRHEPKPGELVAMIRDTDMEVQYGFWIGMSDDKHEYEKAYLNAVAIAHHIPTIRGQ